MNIKIQETGERKTLSIIDRNSGVNWVQDLIGNTGALNDGQFVWDDEANAYITDQGTYDWWAQYIADSETTDAEIDALAGELGISAEEIRECVAEDTDNDYEQHRHQAVRAMQDIRDGILVTSAAATLGRRGGRSTSIAKADAARENGRKGGRHLASYYIRIDSYWQNSGNYFVGPFASHDEAQAEIDRSVSDPQSLATPSNHMAQDVKNGVRIHGILSKTESKRFGLREVPGPDGWNLVGKCIPTTAHEMWRAVEWS